MTTHTTDVQVGDEFIFRGLTGSGDVWRRLTVLGVSVSGDVSFRIELPPDPTDPMGPGIGSAPLDRIALLVEQGIWEGPMRK